MTRDDLSKEKQEEYDRIVDKMMKEIEKRKAKLPPIKQNQLSCDIGNKPYQDVQKEYLPKLKKLFE